VRLRGLRQILAQLIHCLVHCLVHFLIPGPDTLDEPPGQRWLRTFQFLGGLDFGAESLAGLLSELRVEDVLGHDPERVGAQANLTLLDAEGLPNEADSDLLDVVGGDRDRASIFIGRILKFLEKGPFDSLQSVLIHVSEFEHH